MLAVSRPGENRKFPANILANAVSIGDQMLSDGGVTRHSNSWLTTDVDEKPFGIGLPNPFAKDLGRFANIRPITTAPKFITNTT